MVGWIVRPAQPDDLEQTYHLFLQATNDLYAQRNLPLIPTQDPPPARALAFRHHALTHDAERFWVAEDGARIVGFGIAILRSPLWYLAALHVLPSYQGQGIGQQLLRLCMSTDQVLTERICTVISDSLNPHATALYARHGMYPWMPLLVLRGRIPDAGDSLPALHVRAEGADTAPLDLLDHLDRGVLGVVRRHDHILWLKQPDQILLTVARAEQVIGYAYISPAGVGPVAVRDPQLLTLTLRESFRRLQELGVATALVKVPAAARKTLTYLLGHGFRYEQQLLIGASRPFGWLGSYLVSVGDALF